LKFKISLFTDIENKKNDAPGLMRRSIFDAAPGKCFAVRACRSCGYSLGFDAPRKTGRESAGLPEKVGRPTPTQNESTPKNCEIWLLLCHAIGSVLDWAPVFLAKSMAIGQVLLILPAVPAIIAGFCC
jgi:hypothetical protein